MTGISPRPARTVRSGLGLGKALPMAPAEIAVERGYARLEWAVLNWNQPFIEFYTSLGAVPMDERTVYRLAGPALQRVATAPRLEAQRAVPTGR